MQNVYGYKGNKKDDLLEKRKNTNRINVRIHLKKRKTDSSSYQIRNSFLFFTLNNTLSKNLNDQDNNNDKES